MTAFFNGIDVLLQQQYPLFNQRLALVTNDAAFTYDGIPVRTALLQSGATVLRLFSPEHGLQTTGADGEQQPDTVDALTQLPVVSLYGARLAPEPAHLQDVEAVLFDIPDVGCRFYTYLWTLTHVMESCAVTGTKLIVADRPNPTGLDLRQAEGPWLNEAVCSSFIGRWNLPVRHSCTLGELARYFAATRLPGLQLEVLPVQHYTRRSVFPAGAFVPTSPAIRELETAQLYPGTCFLEGVNLNEGRGTGLDFRVAAAPWINPAALLSQLHQAALPGVRFESISYRAVTPPFEGELCHGLRLFVTDTDTFRPVRTGLALLQAVSSSHPGQLQPRLYRTAANPGGADHLDRLTGVPHSLQLIRNQEELSTEVNPLWQDTLLPYLLYQ